MISLLTLEMLTKLHIVEISFCSSNDYSAAIKSFPYSDEDWREKVFNRLNITMKFAHFRPFFYFYCMLPI